MTRLAAASADLPVVRSGASDPGDEQELHKIRVRHAKTKVLWPASGLGSCACITAEGDGWETYKWENLRGGGQFFARASRRSSSVQIAAPSAPPPVAMRMSGWC
jgi:hypothetical protein